MTGPRTTELLALLRECLPLVRWHETNGMEGWTVAPRPDLSVRIREVLGDRRDD